MAMAIAMAFAVGAVAIAVSLLSPLSWVGFAPILALVPALIGARHFLAMRNARSVKLSAPMTPFAMMFLTVFYVTILIVALTNQVRF
jgi:hypothetical protein